MKINANGNGGAREISCEIVEHCGTLSVKGKYELQLNYVRWNGGEAKYDLRQWNTETGKCGKGITLSGEELVALRDLLNEE